MDGNNGGKDGNNSDKTPRNTPPRPSNNGNSPASSSPARDGNVPQEAGQRGTTGANIPSERRNSTDGERGSPNPGDAIVRTPQNGREGGRGSPSGSVLRTPQGNEVAGRRSGRNSALQTPQSQRRNARSPTNSVLRTPQNGAHAGVSPANSVLRTPQGVRGNGRASPAGSVLRTPQQTRRVPISPAGVPTPGSIVPGTPLRRRDLGTSPMRLSSVPGTPAEGASPVERRECVVWGTTINYEESLKKAKEFFEEFTLPNQEEPLYMQMFRLLEEMGGYVLNVDMQYLATFDRGTYNSVVNYPTDLITILDCAANAVFGEKYPETKQKIDADERHRLQTRPYGLRKEQLHTMRDLNPSEITTLISVKGMIIRVSPVIPDIQTALYRCNKCFHTKEAMIEYGRIEEPRKCRRCNSRDSYALLHTRSTFSDKQMMRLQEAPDSVPKGETPATFTLVLYDSLVDCAKPGDRVEVTGILRASPVRLNPKMRSVRSVFRTYIDCVHMAKLTNNSTKLAHGDDEVGGPCHGQADTDEQRQSREQYFEELAQSPLLYETLADSLAPSIFGMRDEKKGVLLQLFGGTNKENTIGAKETGSSQFRSAINVLLVGDPGTSKSQLLQYAHRLAPRGVYTSGRGSSAVGLTAYLTKDPDTNDFVLESGALVLSDRGICCIDEFDKMSDYARSVLHEAMEQQTVSIAKAGIIATLNARTSVLAAANPVGSRYNTNASVVDNIDLPPTLLSRFDLIYLVLDSPSAEEDRRLAQHIVSLFYKNYDDNEGQQNDEMITTRDENGEELMDLTAAPQAPTIAPRSLSDNLETKTLTDYIAYAKKKVHPKLSQEATDALVNGYIEMRSAGRGSKSITATPRQLESLIRLAEAHARMSLKQEVDESDVVESIRLVKSAMHAAAFDPHTGRIDMDLFAMGRSKVNASKINTLANVIKEQLKDMPSGDVKLGVLMRTLRQNSDADIVSSDFREAVRHLQEQQTIAYTANGSAIRLIDQD